MTEVVSPNVTPDNKFERLEIPVDLDGGNFTMLLSPSADGLEITTDQSLTRTDETFPYPLSEEDKGKIRANFPGQMRFTDGHIAQDALNKLRNTDKDNEETREEAQKEYEEKRKAYLSRSSVGLGIRNIRRDGNNITIDTRPVNFPVYKAVANAESSRELLEFGAISAVSMALITADNRLLVTHRSPKNDPYGDMPGASVAGYIDAQFDNKTRTIKPITTQDLKDNVLREMEEELGLEGKDISQLSLDGIVLEKTQVHHEFAFSGRLSLTAKEVKQKSVQERRMHSEEFDEKFVDIEATPEAIFTLLTNFDSPIPPTHAAVFAATGYKLVLERDGLAKAQEYKSALEIGIRQNTNRIDSLVKDYYEQNPDVLNHPTQRQQDKINLALSDFINKNPNATDEERRSFIKNLTDNLQKRRLDGYNAYYLPSEQGLPNFTDSMKKSGLIDKNNEMASTNEAEPNNNIAFLLDVDGVITDPVEKRVTNNELFNHLESQLRKGNKVTLNTGRSNEWMIEQVINPLVDRLEDKSILKNFFAVGEKGLTWATFDSSGQLTQGVFDRDGNLINGFDLTAFLDPETAQHFEILNREAKKLIFEKYSHSTFFDASKKAMVSTEMIKGFNHSRFAAEQAEFASQLRQILVREGLEGKFNIDPTTIATDIQIPEAGKHLGAKRILAWLQKSDSKPQHFIAIGDSSSDLEMADELHAQGKSVDFYYVNPNKPLEVNKPYQVITTKNEFGQGTAEAFNRLAA